MASQPPGTPFSLSELKERLAELDEADNLLDKATRGGIPMEEQKKRSQEIRQQLLKLAQAFYPGQV